METSTYALVLTGSVLPGFAADAVWPALAAYFRMEPERLHQQLLARAPLTIKQGDDLGKLQTLLAGIASVGAEAELCAPDGQAALFVLFDAAPRGPVPRVFVDERVAHGLWPADVRVAEVGTTTWHPFNGAPANAASESRSATGVIDPLPEPAPVVAATTTSTAVVAAAAGRESAPAVEAIALELPPGAAIHAGFWRRSAAYLIDSLIASAITWGVGLAIASASRAGVTPDSLAAVPMFDSLIGLAIAWLYFALQESSARQATLGKRVMGIKVTDTRGRRIGFGLASGRYVGKILSGLVLAIGFMLAGWTTRKQALHDLLAGTLVVFDAVVPGKPLPTSRPPMPWYGWLLNLVLIAATLAAIGTGVMLAGSIANLADVGQGGSGF